MKILKIFGLVAGIHVFALILIFANPGCSSSTKTIPAPTDTVVTETAESPSITVPMTPSEEASPMSSAPITFDPNAPAVAAGGGSRFNPTRPGTSAATTLTAAPVADVVPAATYVVKPGDTLWELGKKHNVPYAEIAAANNIRTNAPLRAGQKLIIPGRAVSAATNPPPAASAKPAATKAAPPAGANAMKHTVKPNETLSMIARMYGVKQGDIAVANNISDPQKIRAGTELIIPGWQPREGGRTPARTNAQPVEEAPKQAPPQEAPRPIINIIDAEPASPATNDVPVIRVDENPMTSSPRGN